MFQDLKKLHVRLSIDRIFFLFHCRTLTLIDCACLLWTYDLRPIWVYLVLFSVILIVCGLENFVRNGLIVLKKLPMVNWYTKKSMDEPITIVVHR